MAIPIKERIGNLMTKRMISLVVVLVCTAAWGADKKEITVELAVPDTTWVVAIHEVYEVGDELYVISIVSQDSNVMGAQVVSTVQDSLKLAAPDLPVKFFVIGKTWNWENEEPYTFIENLKPIQKELKSGKLIYKKEEKITEYPDGNSFKPATTDSDPGSVIGKTWEWVGTITPVERITVPDPERYTIRLTDDGKLQARFDCNRGGGEYTISTGKLSFGPMLSTRMACPQDSLDGTYMRDLQRVVSFFIEDRNLYLELPADGGTMRFRPAP